MARWQRDPKYRHTLKLTNMVDNDSQLEERKPIKPCTCESTDGIIYCDACREEMELPN